jgi:pimeloyl-ACP methyl ester carboxylesterase
VLGAHDVGHLLEDCAVIGVSGGGPTAVEFALRHGERTTCLALVCAITGPHLQPARTIGSIVGRIVFARGSGFLDLIYASALAYAALRPMSFCRPLLAATETFDREGLRDRLAAVREHPVWLRWMRGLIESGYPISARRDGLDNDLRQFAAIRDYPLHEVRCTTLVVHGRFDGDVGIEHAESVASAVPAAELLVAERSGHLLWMSEDEPRIREAVLAFLGRHLRGPGSARAGPA